MKLDKKSIIQITILVVLVAAGGGAYLMSQEGGLGFITDLLPGSETKSEPQPAHVASPAPAPKPAEPAIPSGPAKGQVAGKSFEPDSVTLGGGELAFVQSKEPQSTIRIKLVAPKWETPSGKKFKYTPAGANAPIVTAMRMEGNEMKEQSVTEKYTLLLEFGQEKDAKLPGKLHLALPGDAKTTLAGTFNADIKGFRIVDGKADLSADSVDTLQFLALKELLKDDPDKQLEVTALRDGRITSIGKNRVGYLEVEYRAGSANPETKRYQFVKETEWKVRGAPLALDQIDEAHPITTPGAKDSPEEILTYLAAKQLEASAKKNKDKKGVFGASFITRHNAKTKMGVADVSYKLEPNGTAVKTSYLFGLKQNGWAFNRELKANEKANVDSGKIEKR